MPASATEDSDDSDDSQIPTTRVEGRKRQPIQQRLLVVANRLPVSAVRNLDHSWSVVTAGGLVSAIVDSKKFEAIFIGWPGVSVPDDAGQQTLTAALSEKRCIPVFLSEEIVNQYYNGYCKNILWPLFHNEDHLATTKTFQSQFEAYKRANTMFADVVNKHYQEGDIVWCHDYHLMLLPSKLKAYNSNMKVGWFLHTSFPCSEIFETLPSGSELLHAVLAADLVGFRSHDYERDFRSACTLILGFEGTPKGVVVNTTFSIGFETFIYTLEDPKVQDYIKEYKERFSGKKVMLGVDHLDTIKGLPQKMLAFEQFLDENPDWHDRVVLLQIAVPTRTEVPQYHKLMSQVHEIVGRVNGRFGTLTAVPIHYLDQSLDIRALCAVYSLTDFALLTSFSDGMNFVSYDLWHVKISKRFASEAESFGAEAILIDLGNITEGASAIRGALNMHAETKKPQKCNFKHVTTRTAQRWGDEFLCKLNDTNHTIIEAQKRIREAPIEHAVGRQSSNQSILEVLEQDVPYLIQKVSRLEDDLKVLESDHLLKIAETKDQENQLSLEKLRVDLLEQKVAVFAGDIKRLEKELETLETEKLMQHIERKDLRNQITNLLELQGQALYVRRKEVEASAKYIIRLKKEYCQKKQEMIKRILDYYLEQGNVIIQEVKEFETEFGKLQCMIKTTLESYKLKAEKQENSENQQTELPENQQTKLEDQIRPNRVCDPTSPIWALTFYILGVVGCIVGPLFLFEFKPLASVVSIAVILMIYSGFAFAGFYWRETPKLRLLPPQWYIPPTFSTLVTLLSLAITALSKDGASKNGDEDHKEYKDAMVGFAMVNVAVYSLVMIAQPVVDYGLLGLFSTLPLLVLLERNRHRFYGKYFLWGFLFLFYTYSQAYCLSFFTIRERRKTIFFPRFRFWKDKEETKISSGNQDAQETKMIGVNQAAHDVEIIIDK